MKQRFRNTEPTLRNEIETLISQSCGQLLPPPFRNLIDAIMDKVRDHQEKNFTDYEQSLQGTSGTKRRSPDPQLLEARQAGLEIGNPGKRPRLNTSPEPPPPPPPQQQQQQQNLPPGSLVLNQDWSVIPPAMAAPSQLQPQGNTSGTYSQPPGGNMMISVPTSGVGYFNPVLGAGPASGNCLLVEEFLYGNQELSESSDQMDGEIGSFHFYEPSHE